MNLYFKTEFSVFEVKHQDAIFKLKEGDPTRYMIGKIKTSAKDGKAFVDINEIQDSFIDECLVGWEGVLAKETQKPIEFKKENFVFLTTEIKAVLWQAFIDRCALSGEEKKS